MTMSLSLLQEQSARGLSVRTLASMQVKNERDISLSPPMQNASPIAYPSHHPLQFPPTSMGMFSPFSTQAAAVLMAASCMPNFQGQMASTQGLFGHHPGLYHWQQNGSSPPPPISPALSSSLSPALSTKSTKKNHNNNILKKPKRKVKKEMEITDLPPLSPPTSSSSPDAPQLKNVTKGKSFVCKVCSRSFGYKHVLENHKRTHTGEKPYSCPECNKRFTRDHHLKTHMRLHTGEKPYHCSHCDKQFVQVANLRRHLRVHTGERPYTCNICQNRFSDSNQLKAHMLIHNNEKPFSCERCGIKFRRRHHLIQHKCNEGGAQRTVISDATSSDEIYMDARHEDELDRRSTSPNIDKEKRTRKSNEIRRVIRMNAPQIIPMPLTFDASLPEQTEPEDLSMSTGLAQSLSSVGSPMTGSPSSDHHDDDLEDLDDAATLYLRQRQTKFHRHFETRLTIN